LHVLGTALSETTGATDRHMPEDVNLQSRIYDRKSTAETDYLRPGVQYDILLFYAFYITQ
jgi:hypothetical protein